MTTITGERYTLYCGDCLEVMPTLEAGSVDAIITDLPYGTTACAWDEIIPFAPMWEQVRRLLKPRGVFVTTASQPFTSKLVMSNLEWFRYEWIWEKEQGVNFQICKVQPLKSHENILIFGDGIILYNPQGLRRSGIAKSNKGKGGRLGHHSSEKLRKQYKQEFANYPQTITRFVSERGLHPTQKPVALYEYLILTYTNPGDVVLDICFGSGTTIVAALRTGRRGIGIESDANYFSIAAERIANAAGNLTTTARERASGQLSLLDWQA